MIKTKPCRSLFALGPPLAKNGEPTVEKLFGTPAESFASNEKIVSLIMLRSSTDKVIQRNNRICLGTYEVNIFETLRT